MDAGFQNYDAKAEQYIASFALFKIHSDFKNKIQ